jgi:ADP-ribose pyrophosphatase
MDPLRWAQVDEREALAGFLKIRCRTYRYPDGCLGDWDILHGGSTVAVVALTADDQGILVRQFRPGPGKVLLELPGGNVESDESVIDAAARELLEETGFEAESIEVVATTYLASYATHRRHAVVARACRKIREPRPDVGEFVEPVTLPLPAYVDHVLGGQLTDMDIGLAGLAAVGLLARAPGLGEKVGLHGPDRTRGELSGC